MEELGRLIKVPLREFWEGEASDFTPWLADEENIELLGETILFTRFSRRGLRHLISDYVPKEAETAK